MIKRKYNYVAGDFVGDLIYRAELPNHQTPSGASFRMAEFDCKCGKVIKARIVDAQRFKVRSCGKCQFGKGARMPDHGACKNELLQSYKRIAQNKNLEFSLTREQFLTFLAGDCYYCGSPPSNAHKKKNFARRGLVPFVYNGIDRVDNTKGYVLDNCVTCCIKCNKAKSSMSQEEFVSWARRLAFYQYKIMVDEWLERLNFLVNYIRSLGGRVKSLKEQPTGP